MATTTWNIMRVRKLAATHEIHERTLLKVLNGETVRGAAVAKRAKAAAETYHNEERIDAEPETDDADGKNEDA